ncbi:MAG: flippase [Oligoflexia bacterium]|nr:flippase [Oligoflexia bacterium]
MEADVAADAASIAGGSAIVMAGGVTERGLRFMVNWLLARTLGTTAFGVYSFVQSVIPTLISFSALGADAGMVLFGARYRQSGELGRLKGTLRTCLWMAAIGGAVFGMLLWWTGGHLAVSADRQVAVSALMIGAPSVFFGTLLAVLVGGLVAAKDMRGQAVVNQIGLPLLILLTVSVPLAMDFGVTGALWALAVAYALAVVLGIRVFWRRYGALLRDHAVVAVTEPAALLRYSLPQSLARSLYQANMRIDIVMLTALAALSDVGVYKIAAMVAQLGTLPVMASTTMFGPVVSELVYSQQIERLDALLRVVTRWMVVITAPVCLVLMLVPELFLTIFDAEYASGGRALAVLMLGQAVYAVCSPTGNLVTMGGYSGTNLINGLVSVAVNVALNWFLIPRMGLEGAALASTISVTIWSVLRVMEARWLLGCWAFDRRVLGALAAAVSAGSAAAWLSNGGDLLVRAGWAGGAVVVFLAFVALAGRTPEDTMVLERVLARIARLRR